MRPSSILVAALVAAACKDEPPAVRTEVSIELPPNDEAAAAEWSKLRVQVWPAGTACLELRDWLAAQCAGGDPGSLELWDDRASVIARDAPGPEVALDGSAAWDVAVEAQDTDGVPFLFGCARVASGEPATVHLWRSWGDDDACAGLYHPACATYVRCEIPDSGVPDDPGRPTCEAASEEVFVYEEDGVGCTPDAGYLPLPCRPARVPCAAGVVTPEADGVCPRAEEPACSTSFAENLNCDDSAPPPCIDGGVDAGCDPGDALACGRTGDAGTCLAGTSTCTDAGAWGECVRKAEECDGVEDTDCDGLRDEDDDDADRLCRRGGLADHCGPDGCECGDGRSCGRQDKCCNGECVRAEADCAAEPSR